MRRRYKRFFQRTEAVFLAAVLLVTGVAGGSCWRSEGAAAETVLQNPRIEPDSAMKSGQRVTYDCVWFGSYPQTEIISAADTEAIRALEFSSKYYELEYEKADSSTWEKLTDDSVRWNSNGDAVIDGKKYRRMKKEEATFASSYDETEENSLISRYNWVDSTSWHYFRYEPIRWRVLSVDGDDAFLLADKGLDDQKYNTRDISVTWETSTIRSWLNGYGASENRCGIDYGRKNFINAAFSGPEQSAIDLSEVIASDNRVSGVKGGKDTQDKLFLLSGQETTESGAAKYGFVERNKEEHFGESLRIHDEARRVNSTTYAKAMGVWSHCSQAQGRDYEFSGNADWWLRSPGSSLDEAYPSDYRGSGVGMGGTSVNDDDKVLRPALHLNLSSAEVWQFAGTVCSDGSEDKLAPSEITCTPLPEEPSILPVSTATEGAVGSPSFRFGLQNPRVEQGSEVMSEQRTTYDCIWFGSYPQTEIVSAEDTEAIAAFNSHAKYYEVKYEEADQSLWSKLTDPDVDWDDNGDAVVDGVKYRRMKRDDASFSASDNGLYLWLDATSYHYFRYEPIKWRVLSLEGEDAFLLSELGLSAQKYNESNIDVTWETSTIRSWLNGYGASENSCETDFSSNNFYDAAFGEAEKSAIKRVVLENADSDTYGTEGGNDTSDKIFLLSERETYEEAAEKYGFAWNEVGARKARRAQSSTYAKAMGAWCSYSTEDGVDNDANGVVRWWLRSPGRRQTYASNVRWTSKGEGESNWIVTEFLAVRPALHLQLSSGEEWQFAGTVCSDGTAEEVLPSEYGLRSPKIEPDSKMQSGQRVTYDCIWFGSYPQTEIVSADDKDLLFLLNYRAKHYEIEYEIADAGLWSKLTDDSLKWDANDDAVVDGVKYRRMKRGDANNDNSIGGLSGYGWPDNTSYHYFRYAPIKWRVLSVNGEEAFLLADRGLTARNYHERMMDTSVTWKTSTMRSWLNGYGASENASAVDYSGKDRKNFLDTAFSEEEQSAVCQTELKETEGENKTKDRIFLLSEAELWSSEAVRYGFVTGRDTQDEAKRAKSTTYAKAMGVHTAYTSSYSGKASWILRNVSDQLEMSQICVGSVYVYGIWKETSATTDAVRPALHLDLSSEDVWKEAGVVCSDGTEEEKGVPGGGVVSPSPIVTEGGTESPCPTELVSAVPLSPGVVLSPSPGVVLPPSPDVVVSSSPGVVLPPSPDVVSSSPDVVLSPSPGVVLPPSPDVVVSSSPGVVLPTLPATVAPWKTPSSSIPTEEPSVVPSDGSFMLSSELPAERALPEASEGIVTSGIEASTKNLSVSGVTVQATAKLFVLIRWNRMPSASGYEIWRGTEKGGALRKVKTVKGSRKQFVDKKVKKGQTYYYQLIPCVPLKGTYEVKRSSVVSVRLPWYIRPRIQVRRGRSMQGEKYVEISLRRYQGKYADIYVKRGTKGRYLKLSFPKKTITSYHEKYKFRYRSDHLMLYFKVRTFGRVKGKKAYSDYSNVRRIVL